MNNTNKILLIILSIILIIVCLSKPDKHIVQTNPIVTDTQIPTVVDNQDTVVTNYQSALEKSKKENKKIFLIFTADWCHACQMLKKTMATKEISDLLSNYIVYQVNTDKEKDLVRKFQVSAIPRYFIIDHTEKIYKSGMGYLDVQKFEIFLNKE